MTATKKYKLVKAGDGPKVCAFFTSPDGCRNGDQCPFLHGPPTPLTPEVSETASVISSEESDAADVPSIAKSVMKAKTSDIGDPFSASPMKSSPTMTVEQASKGKKRKGQSSSYSDSDPFANPREKNHSPAATKKSKPNEKSKPAAQIQKNQNKKATPSAIPDFRNLISKLPVAPFSIAGATGGIKKGTPVRNETPKEKSGSFALSAQANLDPLLPTSTEAGRKWIKAITSSRSHERFASSFDFVKYRESNQAAGITSEWIKAKPFGAWCSSNPQAIAIDCEMCETQDPLSGAKNPKALCRISVVNAEKPEEILLDTLVKPAWPVTDHRTRINGISKEDLDNVEFTIRHAQAFMMALCSEETVIVGHAVQNDLAALFMEHHCVADSSFLLLNL